MHKIDDSVLLWNESNGIVSVLILASGDFIELNPIGSVIWKKLADGMDRDKIVSDIIADYDTTPKAVEKDVDSFLNGLVEKGLIIKED